jgi:hypothetical protein
MVFPKLSLKKTLYFCFQNTVLFASSSTRTATKKYRKTSQSLGLFERNCAEKNIFLRGENFPAPYLYIFFVVRCEKFYLSPFHFRPFTGIYSPRGCFHLSFQNADYQGMISSFTLPSPPTSSKKFQLRKPIQPFTFYRKRFIIIGVSGENTPSPQDLEDFVRENPFGMYHEPAFLRTFHETSLHCGWLSRSCFHKSET